MKTIYVTSAKHITALQQALEHSTLIDAVDDDGNTVRGYVREIESYDGDNKPYKRVRIMTEDEEKELAQRVSPK